jgi:diketogulonate reductase-like aldo/keto reductase
MIQQDRSMAKDPTTQKQIRTVALPDGERVPSLGIGTWNMGDRRPKRAGEIAALQTAVDLGMTVVDTAEMYGEGAAERLIGEAIGDRRDQVFLVSKVLPQHATRRGTIAACEASLRRLKTDRLDMYLLHWRGSTPLEETLEAFDRLVRDGKIRHWGVSNFDADDMEEVAGLTIGGGSRAATNQVLYNLMRRGIEYDLLPWCETRGIPVMAYSPLEQGLLAGHKTLAAIAERLTTTPAQVALAWVLRQPDVMAIPKAGDVDHVRQNHAALQIELAPEDLAALDHAFPPPTRKRPLEMI